MNQRVPDPGPFREGRVRTLAALLDAYNRRRHQRGWTFRQLNGAVGRNLDLNSMITRGAATGGSIFALADALGLEIVVQAKANSGPTRRDRVKRLREEAAQGAAEPGGVPGE